MNFEIAPEMRTTIVVILLFIATICAIHLFFALAKDIATMKDQEIKDKFGGYPAEILQPVTLNMLPDLIDKDVYLIGGHPVKIEVKICGE